jgi:RNA polymerase primary sigma factor
MQRYVNKIRRYALVRRDEERELAERIAKGDEQARERLVLGNLRLVVKIAYGLRGRGTPLCDLVAEGNVGLLRAVDRFDPTKGAAFSSYASWWIKHFMRLAIASQGRTVRLPPEAMGKIAAIRDVRSRLAARLNQAPSIAQIAAETGFTGRTVYGLCVANSISLEEHVGAGETAVLGNLIPDDRGGSPAQEAEQRDAVRRVVALLDLLTDIERTVLTLYYGLDDGKAHTFGAIGEVVQRTRQGTMAIHRRALGRLRLAFRQDGVPV